MSVIRNVDIALDYSPLIYHSPIPPKQLYNIACSADETTVNAFRDVWLNNTKANHKKFGPFKDRSLGSLFGKNDKRPAIIVGSGPSLANNVHLLKNQIKGQPRIPVISCLHNFHYMVDQEIEVEYYVSLDAGDVTLEEIAEGGNKSLDEYLEASKNSTLLAFIGSSPKLLNSWKGEILFYNCPIPDQELTKEIQAIEDFYVYVSNGGNVLGACLYIARAIMGSNPIAFLGADFCFSYSNKFHAWNSKYDKDLGNYILAVDVFGNRVKTWQSYKNFKCWFDYISETVPGLYINCSEGGTFGAYPEGNIMSVIQMPLKNFLDSYQLYEHIRPQCENPSDPNKILLF